MTSANLDIGGTARLAVLLAAMALIGVLLGSHAAAGGPARAEDVVGDGVRDAVAADGEARVVVALSTASSGAELAAQGNAATAAAVAAAQDRVLTVVPGDEFQVSRRYRSVPALSGTVNSAGLEKLADHPDVLAVDLDAAGSGGLATSVPLINADHWEAVGIDGEGVSVAVLDSGFDSDHSDLSDDLIDEACFLDFDGAIDGNGRCPNGSDRQTGAGAAEDDHGHGTHVTGIVTSNGTQSSQGVAPGADIVAVKVLDSNNAFAFYSEIVAGLDYIINNRPDVEVINMSLGTNALFSGDCDNATAFNMAGAAAVNTLRANGVTTFVSAGNNGSTTQMSSPGCLSNVISVGATDNADNVAGFSNTNSVTDIVAPGVGTTSSGLGGGTAVMSGTSMASPHAAGCAALFIQAGVATTPDDIEARLEASPVTVTRGALTFPRIDCGLQEDEINPDIEIEKATNGEDADNPTGPVLVAGDPVDWTYEVTNTGDVALENVTVTDDQGVAVSCPETTLAAGGSMTCDASGTVEAGQYANVGMVSGTPPVGPDVTAEDPSHYFGLAPPVADPNGPYDTIADPVAHLDGTASFDPDGTIVSYEWDIDDDGMFDDATGPTPTVTLPDVPGTYPIGLRVTDDDGLTDTAFTEAYVGPDLEITKTDVTPGPVDPGDHIRYEVTVANTGPHGTPQGSNTVRVLEELPAGTHFRWYSASKGVCSQTGSGDLECQVGSLAPDEEVKIHLVIEAPAACGIVTNKITVDHWDRIGEVDETNNTAMINTNVC